MLARLGHFWSVAPAASVYSASVRWASIAWTIPLWLAMALGLSQRSLWHWPRIAAPLMVIGLTLVHAVFWTDLRMRAPIVPAIALIAAGAGRPGGPRPSTQGRNPRANRDHQTTVDGWPIVRSGRKDERCGFGPGAGARRRATATSKS